MGETLPMRFLRVRHAWLVTCLVASALMAVLAGCMSTGPEEQSSEEVLPWNEPAGWEGKILGAPF